ncbi:Uncharacterized protein DBV15_07027 [Temnothorax longispinosus]|uniref:Uncharacterized protein n=1 Tax=Temnothorax longispinosus TaxID=300112 RepID=A0A4S2JDI2_9HYME|nr:Uncharacterized protein DBV15_07027 [Temnothorax longispinosus]
MLLLYMLLFLPTFVASQGSQSMKTLDREMLWNDSRGFLDTHLDVYKRQPLIQFFLFRNRRKDNKYKKLNKYVLPLIIGFLLIKSILLPITLKVLAILSGKAVVLSLMSLILAAIIGLKKIAHKESSYELVNKHRRQDVYGFIGDVQEFEPYRFYKERLSSYDKITLRSNIVNIINLKEA